MTIEKHVSDISKKVNLPALYNISKKYSTIDLKYLNYKFEIPYKVTFSVKYLQLDTISKKEILDIGTGPGWFPMIATHFGHHVVCCDVPSSISSSHQMYEEVIQSFGLKKNYSFAVKPNEKIPSEIGKFDIITCLGMALHHGWNIENWYFFLNDLIENHCKDGVECKLFFQVNRNPAWELLMNDTVFKNRKEIKSWEFFEGHILRASIKK